MGDTFHSKRKSSENHYQMMVTDKFTMGSKMSKRNKENSESRISVKSSQNKNRKLLDQLRSAISDCDEQRSNRKQSRIESLQEFTSSKKLQRLAKLKVISPDVARGILE